MNENGGMTLMEKLAVVKIMNRTDRYCYRFNNCKSGTGIFAGMDIFIGNDGLMIKFRGKECRVYFNTFKAPEHDADYTEFAVEYFNDFKEELNKKYNYNVEMEVV